jgi:hypothetical protein
MDLLPALRPGKLIVAIDISTFLPTLLAKLALRGPLTVLDNGNRFPAYRIAHEIRKRSTQVKEASDRLLLRRAFTDYQTVHLLESAATSPYPQLLLDLLMPYQDEQITPHEADRLLSLCLTYMTRLAHTAPLAVCIDPFIQEEKAFLLKRLTDRADQVFFSTDSSAFQPVQPPLFT